MLSLQAHSRRSVGRSVDAGLTQLCHSAGIPEAPDSMGYRGSLMFHGSSAEATGSIVAVSACNDNGFCCMRSQWNVP